MTNAGPKQAFRCLDFGVQLLVGEYISRRVAVDNDDHMSLHIMLCLPLFFFAKFHPAFNTYHPSSVLWPTWGVTKPTMVEIGN